MVQFVARGKSLTASAGSLSAIDIFATAPTLKFSGKTIDFDEHREYQYGDDLRDIDWLATARTGNPLIKKFTPLKEHTLMLLYDAGIGMYASAPSGELKKTVAIDTLAIAGLLAKAQHYEIMASVGNTAGYERVSVGRSELHLERILEQIDHIPLMRGIGNSPEALLRFAVSSTQRRTVFFVASEEPVVSDQLAEAIRIARSRHLVFWAIIEDMDLLTPSGYMSDGHDVLTDKQVIREGIGSKKLYQSYIQAEIERKAQVDDFLTRSGVYFFRVHSSQEIIFELQNLVAKISTL